MTQENFYLEFNMDDLLFASIDIPMIDKQRVLNEIYPLIGSKHMFWEPYRSCLLYTSDAADE